MDGHLASGSSISLSIDETIVTASELGSEPADLADLREDLIEELIELEVNLKKFSYDYHDLVKRLVNDTGPPQSLIQKLQDRI